MTGRSRPDTDVFDGATGRRGHAMNTLFMSVLDKSAREVFRTDQAASCSRFGLAVEQTVAVLERDGQG